MRVFIISANWGGGGPGGIAADLYKTLTVDGNECCFAFGRGNIPSNVCSYRIGSKMDVYIHALSARFLDNAGFMSKRATKALIEEIKRYRPNIILLQNLLGYTIHTEELFKYIRSSEIPAFWTIHDCWPVTGHCITALCDNWNNGCGSCPNIREFPKSIFLDRSKWNFRRKREMLSDIDNLHLIAPSEWIKKILSNSFLHNYSVTVINNGIDLMTFKPTGNDLRRKYHLEGKIILLAVAGVWTLTKGGDYFFDLIDKFDDSFAFVMIGKGAERYAKRSNRILCLKRTENREELAEWYTAADIFVNPTMGDNFPTVNLEALACGTPVVTFDTGGSGESVGDCGRIVKAGDLNALKDAILSCCDHKIAAEKCVKRAQKYDKDRLCKDYLSLFKSTVKLDDK